MQIGKWHFGRVPEQTVELAAEQPKDAPIGEVGWSESTLYQGLFGKYNPDDLIGRKGFAVYRQMMLDEQVKAVVRFKRDAITSREFYFEEPEDLSETESEKRVSLSHKIIDDMKGSFTDSLNGIMTGMYNGFSMTEIIIGQIEFNSLTYYGIDRLRLRPFDTFNFKVDVHGNADEVYQSFENNRQTIDMSRFIHYVQNPEEDEHFGQSELRAAYRAYWSKDVMIKLFNIFMERRAGGFVYAQPKDGVMLEYGSATYTALQNVLSSITTKSSIIMPSGIDLNIVHPEGKAGFEDAIAVHDKAIAKALLVPNLLGITEQGQTGSYSQSQTQFEAFLMTLDADAKRLEDALNEQLFRRLAQFNWGDNSFPLFRFKPISDERKFELLTMWKDLVTAGAVKQSMKDEERLRNMLDFPDREEEEAAGIDIASSLDAQRLAALKEIIMDYKKGNLDLDTAKKLIMAAFKLGEEETIDLLGDQAEAQSPVEPHMLPGETGGEPSPSPVAPDGAVVPPSVEDTGEGSPANSQQPDMSKKEGQNAAAKAAFTEAIKRVDFAVIDQASRQIEDDNIKGVQSAVNAIVEFITSSVSTDPEKVAQIEIPAALREPLRRAFGRLLKDGYALGTKHAKQETAKTATFAAEGVVPDPLGAMASAYFKSKSFTIAGSLSDRILGASQQVIFNGIKSGIATDEIISNVEETLSTKGFTGGTPSQIDTIVRTNVFEAINEARYDFFKDPKLSDFVEALEYSAIMDDRTTTICSHLDGKTWEKDSPLWAEYRPPNHYNCRSILIAVTVDDTWTPSQAPSVQPQEGFK